MHIAWMIYAAASAALGTAAICRVIRRRGDGGVLYALLGACLAVGILTHVLSAVGLGLGGGALWAYGLAGSAAEAAICWISFCRLCWQGKSRERRD